MNKNNTKILFVINKLSRGGAEGVFIKEAEELSNLGYICEIYTLYPSNFKNHYDTKGYFNLIKKIKKDKITHVYSTLDDANFVAKIARIFTPFKLFCREANETFDKPLKFKIADVVLNFLVYKLVMVAGAVKNSYASYDPFHKSKMVVLYNGVEIQENTDNKKEPNNPIKIIAVGSFTPKKGFEDLITIFKDYVKNKNFVLEIIGNGILFDKISAKIKESEMEDKIKCLGAMDKGLLKNHYTNSDIFVLTSKKEGCPNVLLEAMSFGLAPICFSVGAVPEIIENGLSGIVIAPGDKKSFGEALTSLLNNPQKIIQMGKGAKERVKDRFSFDMHLKKLLNMLELEI